MNMYQALVGKFHQAMGQKRAPVPDFSDQATRELRAKLIMEEAVETVAAMGYEVYATITKEDTSSWWPKTDHVASFTKKYSDHHPVEVIDGLCDLLYVTFGTADAFGIDLDLFFLEVHRSNMAKLKGPKRPDGKQLKPEGWEPPNILGILQEQTRYARAWQEIDESVR